MKKFVLMPVEPTEEMLKAVSAADCHNFELSWAEGYKAMLNAAPEPDVQPVAWVDLLKEADQIVKNKPTWKSFIDGTPLSNDIAVWMADFAQEYASPPPAADVQELVGVLQDILNNCLSSNGLAEAYTKARAALAKWEGK